MNAGVAVRRALPDEFEALGEITAGAYVGAGLPNAEELEREINAAADEPEPVPEAKPALPARFTRKTGGWK